VEAILIHGTGHESIQLQKVTLLELPQILAELESTVASLRTAYPSPAKSDNPLLNLPLGGTLSLLSERQNELASLNDQINQLKSTLPHKVKELERLNAELQPLQNQKKAAVARAKEARTRKEEGGIDEMEQKGRWYRGADVVMREMLDLPA
jgi:DNA repair exonuclease SbcCD ATPase subunit